MLLSLLSGPFKPWLYGALSVAVLSVGATVWYQKSRIDSLSGELGQCKEGLTNAKKANETSQHAIDILIEERSNAATTCQKRLFEKDRLIRDLRGIDALRPSTQPTVTGAVVDAVNAASVLSAAVSVGPDTVLDALNWMLSSPAAGGRDALSSAGSPTGSSGAGPLPGAVVYCADEMNAKNLLKSFTTLRAWAEDMRTILVGLQTGTR